MFTPRQARQGLALLSGIVLWTMSATAEPPPVQADASLTAGEGDQDRGVARPRNPAAGGDAPPVAPPQADRRNTAAAPEAPGPAAPVDDAAAFGSAARQSLNEYLIRDRAIAIQLTTAAQDVAARRYDDAVTALQAVCDAPSDVFVWPEDGRPPTPACALVADLFRRLPSEILAEYERRQGADARRLLTEFERSSRFECERELLRRYEFTAAGAEVLLRAAERAFDRGEFADAARGFQRYFAHPIGQRTSTAETCLRAEVARELAAAGGIIVKLPEFDGSRPVHRAGRVQTGGAWRKELLESLCRRPPPATAAETDWRLAMGNGQAHRPVTGSLPTLEPLWSASHDEPRAVETAELQTVSYETAPRGSDLLEHWAATRHERRLPCAGANFALVDGERLLVRDFSGVSARDLRTGAVLWQYPCAAGLVQRATEIQAASKASATPPAPFDPTPLFNEFFAQNSVLGMLASDGERVYCVDLMQDAPAGAGEGAAAGSLNRLVALALHDAGQTAGTLVWQATGEGWCFLGPPLPAHDRLYVIAERESMVSLLALDARTGNTIWSQPISLVDAAVADDPQRARQACSPTMAGGIIVCPTQLGTIVGVDARTGTLAWVYSYAEANGPSQPWRKSRAFDREHGTPEFPNLAAIVGGTVLVLAPQSGSVHCLDLQTGTQRWTVDRDEAHYAATVGEDLVLLVGPRTCVARRFSNGEEVWRQPIDTPTGRGLAIGDRFLLPTADGRILSLDLRTGQVAPDLLPRLDRKRSVALRAADGVDLPSDLLEDDPIPISGNLLCSGEFIVACSPSGVAVYPQAQVVLDAIRDESRTGSLSAAGWLERGELELRLGDVLAAERSLVNALQTNPSPRTRAVAESRLRELLYAELSRNADIQARLAALDGLCVEPADRARFLSERLQRELQARGVDAARDGRRDRAAVRGLSGADGCARGVHGPAGAPGGGGVGAGPLVEMLIASRCCGNCPNGLRRGTLVGHRRQCHLVRRGARRTPHACRR
ncbi:MAG: PQQ-binding-like beta-propeller repeat protein [Planctomycetaceae bacterium]